MLTAWDEYHQQTSQPDGRAIANHEAEAPTFGRIPEPRAVNVRCDDVMLWVEADDGRQLGVPLARFPRLATQARTNAPNWELLGRGIGIHWPDVDENISVARLFGASTD